MKTIIFKLFSFLFFFSLFSDGNTSENNPPKFYAISIGNNCYPANFLRACGFRKSSFPLDWMLSNNFEGLQKAFEEDFIHFLDPDYLTYDESTQTIYNTRYGFSSDHYWDHNPVKYQMTKYNFLNYCVHIRGTFERRIQRLLNALKSDVPIYLLRKKAVDYLQLLTFRDFLLSKYPQINLTIIVFDEIDNPYPEVPNIRYYKINNVDNLPDPIILSGFASDPSWAAMLKDLEWLKDL